MGTIEAKAVIGANYGDEGKGLVTDFLANEAMNKYGNCLVICNNGGAQRSHTVVLEDGTRHAFRHFGSGTFRKADTYLSEHFILNPIIFREEFQELGRLGFKPKVYIDKDCRVSTFYEMILNQMLEQSRENKHGSCGLGIWETEKVYRYNNIWHYKDFKSADTYKIMQEMKVRENLFIYNLNRYRRSGTISKKVLNEWFSIINDYKIRFHFLDDLTFILENTIETDAEIVRRYDSIIFENGQGLLLNRDKNNVHTTPSYTGMHNIIEFEKSFSGEFYVEPYYVTRTYMTRHGAGQFETECKKENLGNIEYDKTNIPNPHQGILRYGTLDFSELLTRIRNDTDREFSLYVTHTNEVPILYNELVTAKRATKRLYLSCCETKENTEIKNIDFTILKRKEFKFK